MATILFLSGTGTNRMPGVATQAAAMGAWAALGSDGYLIRGGRGLKR
mgnify:CR=1 FL=1